MSETETWSGKLEEVMQNEGELSPDFIARIIDENTQGYEYEDLLSVEDNFCEAFGFEETFILIENRIFKVLKKVDLQFDNLMQAHYCEDGTIDFLVQYHNGGCALGDALEEAINNMENK